MFYSGQKSLRKLRASVHETATVGDYFTVLLMASGSEKQAECVQ